MGRSRGTNGPGEKDREDIAPLSSTAGGDAEAKAAVAPATATAVDVLTVHDASLATAEEQAAKTNTTAVSVPQDEPMYLALAEDTPAAAAAHANAASTPAMVLPASLYVSQQPRTANTTPTQAGGHMPPRFPPFRENYNDMTELRRELKVLSVQMNLPYYMHHSSPQRLEARCPTWKNRKEVPTTCEFVVAANRHTNGRVYVTRAVVAHSLMCPSVQQTGNFVSAAALMETAKPFMLKLADTVKPRDMANIMKEKFGVSTSYMTAWRALTAFKQEKKQEETSSFTKIAGYLDAFVKSNEGSVAAFEHLPDATGHTFSRAFLCPKPLQSAVRLCRSQILLSVFLITSTHGGVVMSASAQDAMGDNVPIAVGIALNESEESWRFFLENLRVAIPDLDQFVATLVFNRGPSLQQAASTVFPKCAQSDGVDAFFSTPHLLGSTSAASASSSASTNAQNTLQWIEALCSKTPLMILVGWVSKVASTLFQRFERYGKMSSEYPEEFHALISQYEAEANDHEVVRISEHGYEVIDQHTGRQRIVDFVKQSCTCGEYEASRFPCLHVFLAVSFAGLMRADVIPAIFLMKSLKSLYMGRVTPIDVDTVESDNVTVPNPLPKARGRPRKVQQIQQFTDVKHDKLACSICGVKGHNKRTCKRVISGSTGGLLGGMGGVDGEDQGFLHYGEAVFHGDIAAVPVGDQADTSGVAGDESPGAKRRKIAAKTSADGLTETTIV